MEVFLRIWRFSVEDLHNRLFLRYKIITEDPDRDLIRVPMIHCALNCRHFESISKRVQTSIDSKIHCTSRQTCNMSTNYQTINKLWQQHSASIESQTGRRLTTEWTINRIDLCQWTCQILRGKIMSNSFGCITIK